MGISHEQIDSYVVADDDHVEQRVNVFREVKIGMFAGVKQRTYGAIHHQMENGHHVNVHSDGTVEDFVTGKKMRKV